MKKKKINRKEFLKKSVIGGAGLGAMISACQSDSGGNSPNILNRKKYRWTMVTTWPPNFPVLGEGCNKLAEEVKEMSEGQMEIQVYGGGELIPAFESFDAVSSGTAHMGHGAAYYWAGKAAAAQFFCTVPFGLNAQQMNSWLLSGGGMKLWKELYADFNLVPFPAGNTGVQMAGWFNKEINSTSDLKGLKMRIPGFGGKVLEQVGGTALSTPGSEIYTNLERGVIDATEWIGPYHDYKMGFHQIAKYYYGPGWHEPGPTLELIVNKAKFDALPTHLQRIIEVAALRFNLWSLSEFEAQNAIYLEKIREESKVEVRMLDSSILAELKKATSQILEDLTAKDAFSKKVFTSLSTFQKHINQWANWTEKAFYNSLK